MQITSLPRRSFKQIWPERVALLVQGAVLEKKNASLVVAPKIIAVTLVPSMGMSMREGLTAKLGRGGKVAPAFLSVKLAEICALELVRLRMVNNGWLLSGLMKVIGVMLPLAAI